MESFFRLWGRCARCELVFARVWMSYYGSDWETGMRCLLSSFLKAPIRGGGLAHRVLRETAEALIFLSMKIIFTLLLLCGSYRARSLISGHAWDIEREHSEAINSAFPIRTCCRKCCWIWCHLLEIDTDNFLAIEVLESLKFFSIKPPLEVLFVSQVPDGNVIDGPVVMARSMSKSFHPALSIKYA